jgi:hypothetical protein
MATILDSLIGSYVNKLQGIITQEAILILGVKEELRKQQERMKQIQCFISDAEQRGMEDSAVLEYNPNYNVSLVGTLGGPMVRLCLLADLFPYWNLVRPSYKYIL